MPTEGVTVTYTGEDARRRRIRFEPRPGETAYTRVAEVEGDDGWRAVGQEIVAGLEVEVDSDCQALEVVA